MSDKITRPEGMSDADYIIYLTDQISDIKEEELRSKITKMEEEIGGWIYMDELGDEHFIAMEEWEDMAEWTGPFKTDEMVEAIHD